MPGGDSSLSAPGKLQPAMKSADPETAPRTPRRPSPLDHRLLFVTGKGGAGKSTVAAALGVAAARRGRRTIVAELARRDDVPRKLTGARRETGFEELEISPGLFWISIDPQLAMEEYLVDQLPVRALADLLTSSRLFTYLAAATPGLRELLAIGKVWELAQAVRRTPGAAPYDQVIVDAPATGHGVAFLAAPRTFAGAAGVGPIARQARTIHGMLIDRKRTGVVAVTAPTEASVTETIELSHALAAELGQAPERVILNGMLPRRFSAGDAAQIARALSSPTGAAAGSGLRAARESHARVRAQASQAARLRRALGPVTSLPFLFEPELGLGEIERLATLLESRL